MSLARQAGAMLVAAALAATTGCSPLAVLTGGVGAARSVDSLAAPIPEPDSRGAYLLGRAGAEDLLDRYPVWTEDPEATRYLNDLGQALALFAQAENEPFRGYRFAILDTPEPVAYALPGAFVFVSRGVLRVVESEEELAAVLAHEIEHIALGHSVAALQQAQRTRQMTTVGAELAGAGAARKLGPAAGPASSLAGEVVAGVVDASYSRDAELAADQSAVALLERAGYPAGALHRLLARFEAMQDGARVALLDTHPALDARIEALPSDADLAPSPLRQQRFETALAVARADG